MCVKRCEPLKTLEELLKWRKNPDITGRIENLRSCQLEEGRKIFICHDFKGNYLDDAFIDGSKNADEYRFFHWPLIDGFIYFSHHFITIPPISWINACHINSTPCLGTIITEDKIGYEMCKRILSSRKMIFKVCDKLAKITAAYKLDGWLLNIENNIPVDRLEMLDFFVEEMTRITKTVNPNAVVIWYDSVISSGKLKWQNELNWKNVRFFERCDYFYLNYAWTKKTLENTKKMATSIGRENDVIVGIDVFGRMMIGGGGYNTRVALDEIGDMSVVIFAPGWTLETQGVKDFLHNEIKFWSLLDLKVRKRINWLPFSTNFSQGCGYQRWSKGYEVNNESWFNLSLMRPQTHIYRPNEIAIENAFSGGNCLRLIDFAEPLIQCDFPLICDILFVIFYKCAPSVELNLKVEKRVIQSTQENRQHLKIDHQLRVRKAKEIFRDDLLTSDFSWSPDWSIACWIIGCDPGQSNIAIRSIGLEVDNTQNQDFIIGKMKIRYFGDFSG